jgi:hypothetical protein
MGTLGELENNEKNKIRNGALKIRRALFNKWKGKL